MLTITLGFEKCIQGLELTDEERAEASRQQNVLRDNLRQHLGGVERDILSGSYSRRTAIRPLDDIDLFVILDRTVHRDVYPPASPEQCLRKVQRALALAYPNKAPATIQGRSVNIVFHGTGIGYDVVPAFAVSGGLYYMIPDRSRRSWINTDPERHKDAGTAANARAGSKLNPLVKLAKHWNRGHGAVLQSFHIEVMAYRAFNTPPATYPDGIAALFEHLAGAVMVACPEPAGVGGPNVDAGMTSQDRAAPQRALLQAAASAKTALELDRLGRAREAHGVWRELFGDVYPERGN
jgi:hypothetical protein